jgi:predicted trehalose synthase
MLEIHPRIKLWALPTAGDPAAAQWWDRLSERLSAVLARVRGEIA